MPAPGCGRGASVRGAGCGAELCPSRAGSRWQQPGSAPATAPGSQREIHSWDPQLPNTPRSNPQHHFGVRRSGLCRAGLGGGDVHGLVSLGKRGRAPAQVEKGLEERSVRGDIIEICSFLRRGSGEAAPSLLCVSSGRTRGNSWGCVRAGLGGTSGKGSLPGGWLVTGNGHSTSVTEVKQNL